MAFYNPKPYVHLLIFMTFFLLLLDNVKSNDSIRFTFPNFWSDLGNITFHGDAITTAGTLQLTRTDENGIGARQSAGQAVFSENVHLWDSATGRVSSFYTSFTFLLKITIADEEPADGFGFFLAPPDFNVKDFGGNLGLFNFSTATDTSKNEVVAVEFDTWINREYNDPEYRHIGIDVDSIVSVATKRWNDNDVFSGSIGTAHISYDANSKVLTCVVTYPNGGDYTLSYVVDLTKVLPEWIRVGFSAGTGHFQVHYILSWHFSSTLEKISVGSEKQNIRSVV